MSVRTKTLVIALSLLVAIPWLIGMPLQGASGAANEPLRFTGPLDRVERIAQSPMRPYAIEELHRWFGRPRTKTTAPEGSEHKIALGESYAFRVYDNPAEPPHVVTATLAYAGPAALMYVDRNVQVDRAELEAAARTFEESIVAKNRAIFGEEAFPSEPVAVLHTVLKHAGGYFSPADAQLHDLSENGNPAKLLVIGVDSYQPGTDAYLSILAHEFQHMIHAHQQPTSPAWFNEGLSTLAQDWNGYPDDEMPLIYLAEPGVGLTGWAPDAAETGSHYGAANLFLRYFTEHYAAACDVACLMRRDAGNHPEEFAQAAREKRPDLQGFSDLVADWAVANVVNDPQVSDGRFAYVGLPAYANLHAPDGKITQRSVSQFGVDYLGVLEGPLTLSFDGDDAVSVAGAHPDAGEWMWWSNRGDGQYATLTRAFDLGALTRATLRFSAWHEIERHFDYGYVTVSEDAGKTWRTLPGKATTASDPQGQNMGDGFTGVSGDPLAEVGGDRRGRWIEEEIDLTPYAGKQILLRFWLVNDAAFNAAGLLLDQICIQELGYCDGAENESGGWQAQGFVRTTGGIAQAWEVRLAARSGASIRVTEIQLDARNRATIDLNAGEQGVLVILAAAEHTDEPARYQVRAGVN